MFRYSNEAIDNSLRIFLISMKDPKPIALQRYAKVQGRFLQMGVLNALLTALNCPEAVQIRSAAEWAELGNPVLSWMETKNPDAELSGGFPYRIYEETVSPKETFGARYCYVQMFPNSACRYPDIVTKPFQMQVLAGALMEKLGTLCPLDRNQHLKEILCENGRELLALYDTEDQMIRYRNHVDRANVNRFLECLLHEYFVYRLMNMEEAPPDSLKREDYTCTANIITLICCSALHISIEEEKLHLIQNMPEGDSETLKYLILCRTLARELVDQILWRYYRNMEKGVPDVSYVVKEEGA